MRKIIPAAVMCFSVLLCLAGCDTEVSVTDEPSVVSAAESETAAEESETETEIGTSQVRAVDYSDLLSGLDTFGLSSTDLTDGTWSDIISNTGAGENCSPALSWEPVEGASLYVIYMVDRDASFWIHWKANDVTETELPQGWASEGYVGPYPPEGSVHTYDIYVIALRAPLERLMGGLDNMSPNFPDLIWRADTDADGNSGNIISYGHISGTFTGR